MDSNLFIRIFKEKSNNKVENVHRFALTALREELLERERERVLMNTHSIHSIYKSVHKEIC